MTGKYCSGIINLLFDGFTDNTRGHFTHCSQFSSPLRGSEKYYATRIKYPRVLSVKPSNKVYVFLVVQRFLHAPLVQAQKLNDT